MNNYLNFKPRLDISPRVKIPMVSEVYFAWCHQNNEGEWEEGECYLQPDGFYNKEHPSSVDTLEEDRRGNKFDLDYEKGYFDDHYLMLVVKMLRGDKEKTLFFTPEHAYSLLSEIAVRALRGEIIQGDILQSEYSWEELNLIEKEEDNE